MKRVKQLTKRQRKARDKFLKEMAPSQPIEVTEADVKPRKKSKVFLPLSAYLAKQAEKKHAKMHERGERRAAKADKIAVRKAAKEAKRLAREAKEAKKAKRNAELREAAQ